MSHRTSRASGLLAALVLSSVGITPAAADPGDQVCFPLFRQAGAIPSTEYNANLQCRTTASTISTGLGTYYCTGSGRYDIRYCGSPLPKDNGCPRDSADEENRVGNPCDVSTGSKFETAVDYRDAGSSLDLTRYYNSSPTAVVSGAWGGQWQSGYWRKLTLLNASTTLVVRSDGKAYYYRLVSGAWRTDADTVETLTKTADGWELRDPSDGIERYDTTGNLLALIDRAGRQQSFLYSDGTTGANGGYVLNANGNPTATALPAGLLIQVIDHFGRGLQFGYNSAKQVVAMTDPAGGRTLYGYQSGYLQMVTYSDGRQRQYLYNESAHTSGVSLPNVLTGIIDEKGNRFATFRYDAQGRAISTEHADGAGRMNIAYSTNSAGAIASAAVTDAFTTTRTHTFARLLGKARNTGITQPSVTGGSVATTNSYDANGNRTSHTDFNGIVTTYSYDLARNLETARTEAQGTPQARTITTTWHPNYRLPVQVDEPGKRTRLNYDATGNLLSKTIIDTALNRSRTESWTYNVLGQVLTADGPRTDRLDITTYAYYVTTSPGNYTMGDLATVTDALGHVTTITQYDANGRPLSITDANGVVTTLTYSPRGWLTSRTMGTQATTYDYDGTGQLIKVTLPDASSLTYTYDAAHRLTDVTDAAGNTIHYTLDAMGNRTREDIKDPGNTLIKTRSRVFDALNRLHKDIGGTSPTAQITQYGYDDNGNLTSISDPLNRLTRNGYDALNRLITVTDPASGITTNTYNALDQTTQVKDPRLVSTTYTIGALGDITLTQSPDSGNTQNVYDAAGNITQKTDARGVVSTYTYDALNRLIGISYPGSPAENASFTYDSTANGNKGVGRLTGYSNDGGTTVLTYDVFGNVTQQTEQIGNQYYVTVYQYDSANRISQITYPSGRIVLYTRNTLGQVTQIDTRDSATASLLPVVSNISYQPFGPIKNLTFGNGVTTTLQHDNDHRPQRISSSTLPAWDFAYSYDAASNIRSLDDQVGSYDKAFDYDVLDRLIVDINNTGAWTYQYDANGNPTRRTWINPANTTNVQISKYEVDSNRLTKVANTSVATDAAGNITAKGLTFAYDNANHLATVSSGSTVKASFLYNGLNQRTAKLQVSKPVHFHYAREGHLLGASTYYASGVVYQHNDYLWLDDIPVAQIRSLHSSDGSVNNRRLTYIHADHLNTPRAMSDAGRRIVWRWDGDAFGWQQPNQNPDGDSQTDILNLRFAGQYADAETGLVYNWHRYYDPTMGRYTQSDPIGLEGGLNTYGYVGGNPVNFIDPLGLYQMCHRNLLLPIPGARHCYVKYGNGNTSSYDPSGVNPDPDPNQSGTACTEPKEPEKDQCIEKAMQNCQGSNYSFTGFNCCHCAEQAMKQCGASVPPNSWPNWPINPGPQPGEPGYSSSPLFK